MDNSARGRRKGTRPEHRTFVGILTLAVLAIPVIASACQFTPRDTFGSAGETTGFCDAKHHLDCLEAQEGLSEGSLDRCVGTDNHVCFAPLGKVSPDLVRHLVDHYEQQYGLRVGVLKPIAIPEELVNQERYQVDVIELANLMEDTHVQDSGSAFPLVIGLTSVDVYFSVAEWRYAFGAREPEPVISTARMDPAAYGLKPNDDLLFTRARKLVSKYIGMLYFHLPPSDDPDSALFNSILSPYDLDRMNEPLPVESY
jgi:predicted Zn-dependent protease